MKIMNLKEKVSKFIVVTMASALVVSSMFTDYGFATHANETAGGNVPELESVTGNDNLMLAAEPVPLYDYAQPSDNFVKPDLSNPFLFSVYTNKMTRTDHVEGNVAIGVLPSGLNIYGGNAAIGEGGVSYIGDLSTGSFGCTANGVSYVVIPSVNPLDGTQNKLSYDQNNGYTVYRVSADEVRLSNFFAGNLLKGFSYQDNIKDVIAGTISSKAAWSAELYALPDMDTDSAYVINVTYPELDAGFSGEQKYEDKIIAAAEAGKTVIVNIVSGGEVKIPHMNINNAAEKGEYVSWAGRVLWNCGNASKVSTGRAYGFILAPSATIVNQNNIIGGIIAGEFEQYGEVHQVHWNGVIPSPPVEPTPGPIVTPEPTIAPIVPPVEPTPGPIVTPEPTTTPDPGPTTPPGETPGPTVTPGPTTPPGETPGPTVTPGPTTPPGETPGPTTTPGPLDPTPAPEVTPEPTPGPLDPTPAPEIPSNPTPTPPPTVTEPPQMTQPPQVTEPPQMTQPPQVTEPPAMPGIPVTPDTPATPELNTPDAPVTPQTPTVNGVRRRRTVRIDDDEIPLSDAMVLGARRRPQTGDESDAWMMMFLASLSALAAWILKGVKK